MTQNDFKIESLTKENSKLKNEKKREIALDEKLISDLKKRCEEYKGKKRGITKKIKSLKNEYRNLKETLRVEGRAYGLEKTTILVQ